MRSAARKRRRPSDQPVIMLLFLCGAISVLTTMGIVASLFGEASRFFAEVSLREFLTNRLWTPLFTPQNFGVMPLIAGTMLVTVIAALVAVPLGVGSAIYLSEYAPARARQIIKPVLEVLAGVPTITYGYFALTFITPILRQIWPDTNIFNALSAGIAVGVMILPMIASMSEDAMRAVPQSLRHAAYALGATRMEVSTRVVLPAAISGMTAAFMLGAARAVGETMIVAIAAGGTPRLTLNPLESVQTMTGFIVQVSLGDTPHGSVAYNTLFAVGLTLFLITLSINLIARHIARKYREVYQ